MNKTELIADIDRRYRQRRGADKDTYSTWKTMKGKDLACLTFEEYCEVIDHLAAKMDISCE